MAPSRALWRQANRLSAHATRVCTRTPIRQIATQCRTASASPTARTSFQTSFFPRARLYSTEVSATPEAPDYLSEAELKIYNIIVEKLQPSKLEVQDISGGCGSMYALDIVSTQFKGLTVIKQHRLVNSVLAEEIKKWHGVQLKTKAP